MRGTVLFLHRTKTTSMKKLNSVLFVLIAGLLIIPSCSKKSSPAQTCRIITIQDVQASTTTYNITYNNQGQISTLQSVSGSTTTNKVFTYSGNTELIVTTSGGSSTTDSITLNSSGLILSDLNVNGANKNLTTYTYSGTQVEKSVAQANGTGPIVTTVFTFSNGDMTGFSDGTNTASFTYDAGKPSATGDYWQIVQLVNYGAPFVKTTHLVTGYTQGSTIDNFNYSFDNTGKITSLVNTAGSNVETISYQYSCS
jgi:hypothetical protein